MKILGGLLIGSAFLMMSLMASLDSGVLCGYVFAAMLISGVVLLTAY